MYVFILSIRRKTAVPPFEGAVRGAGRLWQAQAVSPLKHSPAIKYLFNNQGEQHQKSEKGNKF